MAKVVTSLYGELAIIPRQSEVPIRETMEFLTDVMESYNGSEQRLQLRAKARRTLAYSVPLQAAHLAGAFNTEWGGLRKEWAVPIWTESQYIGTVLENQNTLVCNTDYYDLRDDSLALLYTGCDEWQMLEIDTVAPGLLNLTTTTQPMKGCWLVPVRLGWIGDKIERPINGYNGKSNILFEIDDTREYTPDAAVLQYAGDDFYTESGLLSGGNVDRIIEQRLDENDFDLGIIARRSPWSHARIGTPYRQILQGHEQVFKYKQFLQRRAGRFRRFWLPSFEINMRVINTGEIGNKLIIRSDSYMEYAQNRKHIAIQLMSGDWYPMEIVSAVQTSADAIELTLPYSLYVTKEYVARVSYMGLHRLDADRIELNWASNNTVDIEVRILELTP